MRIIADADDKDSDDDEDDDGYDDDRNGNDDENSDDLSGGSLNLQRPHATNSKRNAFVRTIPS